MHVLFFCSLVFVLIPSAAFAETYFVRQAGDDRADGKQPSTAFRTFLRASQSINHGDRIIAGPGEYRELVVIADRFGTPARRIEIFGDESGNLTNDAPGGVVVVPSSVNEPAFRFFRIQNLTVAGITLRGTGRGLLFQECRDVRVERSTFDGLTQGVAAEGCEDLRLETSVFSDCVIAQRLQGCVRSRIAHVTVVNSSSAGVLLLNCGAGQIRNSLIANNNSNYVADSVSAASWTSDHNVLAGTTGPWEPVPIIANVFEWNAASGQDRNSVHVCPAFTTLPSSDFHISADGAWAGGLPGNHVGAILDPPVDSDRDGKPFRSRCAGAYDYPDCQFGSDWKKVAEIIDAGPRQSAGLYLADGTLVRTLLTDAAGVRDLWWDGLDDYGQAALPGSYELRSLVHDVRLIDDGSFGDNGSPQGTYHPDDATRVIAFPDGTFMVATPNEETGILLRRYAASGQPVYGTSLADGNVTGLARYGDEVIGIVGKGTDIALVRFSFPADRALMPNGTKRYSILSESELDAAPRGLAVANNFAYVALAGLNVVRVFDLRTGEKQTDWAVPQVADIAADDDGALWVISGAEVLKLGADGSTVKRFASGLNHPLYLAVNGNQIAISDTEASKIAVLDIQCGSVICELGQKREKDEYWVPVAANAFRDPRGLAFLPDGRLLVTEHSRIRMFYPENPDTRVDLLSDFADTAVVHPVLPEFVYTNLGIYRVATDTGAWRWVVEGKVPQGQTCAAVVLADRPFIAYHTEDRLLLFDVTEPLHPRLALTQGGIPGVYSTLAFSKGGDIVLSSMNDLTVKRISFQGLDEQQNPLFDFARPSTVGPPTDPIEARQMIQKGALTADPQTGDLYYLATTEQHAKLVPGWGASGTGVGKSDSTGSPKWFSLSSGGNYMSISAEHDGKQAWVFAAKDFGGQIDVFDTDGLRVATHNWAWRANFRSGFVDNRYGVRTYLRPDGKVGAYVEDDAYGRLLRARLDGATTLRKRTMKIRWEAASPRSDTPSPVEELGSNGNTRTRTIPKVPELKVNGDWSQWESRKVQPQIVLLPGSIAFKRIAAKDLSRTFHEATLIGALAHDGQAFYVYFLVSDSTSHFEANSAGELWKADSIELWLEEEQFGMGLLSAGESAIEKYRFYSRDRKPYQPSQTLPRENIWAAPIADLSTHPLGTKLASLTGVSFADKGGYAVMARIPFSDVKLVGGIAERDDTVRDMTGRRGEVVRVGVALDNISASGRWLDYQAVWPSSLMFSDPTRSYPFQLGD